MAKRPGPWLTPRCHVKKRRGTDRLLKRTVKFSSPPVREDSKGYVTLYLQNIYMPKNSSYKELAKEIIGYKSNNGAGKNGDVGQIKKSLVYKK